MMFKSTQPLYKASRRLQLTTKQASVGGGYYKGNRVGSMGWHTKHGGYIIDLRKVRTYVPPSTTDSAVRVFQTPVAQAWQLSRLITTQLRPFVPKIHKKPMGPKEVQEELESKGLWEGFDQSKINDRVDASWIGKLDGKKYLDMWKDDAQSDPERTPRKTDKTFILPGQQPDYELRTQLHEATETRPESAKSSALDTIFPARKL